MHEKTHTRTSVGFVPMKQKSNMRLHEATHAKGPGKVKGRPAGRQSKRTSKVLTGNPENMEINNQNHEYENQEINEETPDEIGQFIAEMEKDQAI